MQTMYMTPRTRRMEMRTLAGRCRGARLAPVGCIPFRQSEAGTVTQTVTIQLDQVAGELISEVTAGVVSVFVPALAIDALLNPESDYPGNAEVFRERLLTGDPVFPMEPPSQISDRMGVNGKRVNGEELVCSSARIAHNAAVNFLRRRLYHDAEQLPASHKWHTASLLSSTTLQRFNAVLDPEDRVNGAVSLEGRIPVSGLGRVYNGSEWPMVRGNEVVWETSEASDPPKLRVFEHSAAGESGGPEDRIRMLTWPGGRPAVFAEFGGDQQLSLEQFYRARRMDRLTRMFDAIIRDNPEHGEEQLSRVVHGLHVDPGKTPFVLYEQEWPFGVGVQRPMDGPSMSEVRTNLAATRTFTVPVPATEFGGNIITFIYVKPDETLDSQPHPILGEPWTGVNFAAEDLLEDPVPIRARDLDSNVDQADENTIVMWTGRNELLRRYTQYGFTRETNLNSVEAETSLWQHIIPLSVTPQTVIYPMDFPQYPWPDQQAQIVRYTYSCMGVIQTPRTYGPTPIENMQIIDDDNLFEDVE